MKRTKNLLIGNLCALAFMAAPCCNDSGDDAETNGATDAQNVQDSYAAFVVTTDYTTGSYAVVDPEARTARKDIGVIHQDAMCRFDPITEKTFVIARMGSDAIQVIDGDWSISSEYSVGAGSNPQTIAVASTKRGYVPRMGAAEILVVDPLTGEEKGTVDLAEHADADGIAEATGALLHEGKIYVPLARLESFMPTEFSSVAVIDAETGEVETTVELTATNPAGTMRYDDRLGEIVLIESGSFDVQDGGVELLDPAENEVSGLIVTEEQLGGDIIDVYLHSDDLAYAIIGVAAGEAPITHLVTFDPGTGELIDEILTPTGWVLQSFEPTPDGEELWVADRTANAPGIRIFDAATSEELTGAPIDVGLPPHAICFTAPSN